MDNVEHPLHYNQGSIECIDAIKQSMSRGQYKGFLKGNVMKYLWRYESKDDPVQDLRKAAYYLHQLIDEMGEDL